MQEAPSIAATGWQARLATSPALFPLTLDPVHGRVDLRVLPAVEYERASFLDGRLTAPTVLQAPYAEVAEAAAGLPIACDYIFHIGHVGSTLLSRLLGTHPRVFSLREPLALRLFAQSGPDPRLDVFLALYSRVWAPPQRALIKATSLVSEIAGRMLAPSPDARALMMTVAPDTYLATILAGPNSRLELRSAAPARLARLARRLGRDVGRVEALSEGELCAMTWACEMTALRAAAAAAPGRTTWIDFDAFLADPALGLAQALTALHGVADEREVARMAASPYLQRYSKAPEYAYGPALRAQLLDDARRTEATEIARGLAWLEAAGVA